MTRTMPFVWRPEPKTDVRQPEGVPLTKLAGGTVPHA
jgi:hypothetical protein